MKKPRTTVPVAPQAALSIVDADIRLAAFLHQGGLFELNDLVEAIRAGTPELAQRAADLIRDGVAADGGLHTNCACLQLACC